MSKPAQAINLHIVGPNDGFSTGQSCPSCGYLSVKLSRQEAAVLGYYVRGWKSERIAQELCLSPKSVATYIHRIHNKLEVRTTPALADMDLRVAVIFKFAAMRRAVTSRQRVGDHVTAERLEGYHQALDDLLHADPRMITRIALKIGEAYPEIPKR